MPSACRVHNLVKRVISPPGPPYSMLVPMKILASLLLLTPLASAQVTIKTTTILDGKGHTLKNQTITVDGARIAKLANTSAKPDYDLSGLTVLPGWIDTHVHLTWHF